MSEQEFIDAESLDAPQNWEDIPRFLMATSDKTFEVDYEAHERHFNPNGLALRDTLEVFAADTDMLAERITAMFPTYLRKLKPEMARRYFQYAAKGLIEPTRLVRAIDRAELLSKAPGLERQIERATNPARHRAILEDSAKRRSSMEPLRFNIAELDALIPGGIGMGKVLNIVAGEGGLKTSLLLHILIDYVERGGRALCISLDMSPVEIECRLLMRILNCTEGRALAHIRDDTQDYRRAKAIREGQDTGLTVTGGPLTLAQLEAVILSSQADVIALDYVSIVSGFPDELSAARAVTQKVRQWRDRWGLTFVLLSQMSRAARADQAKGGAGGHALGGSSLEQLTHYELELLSDAPLLPGGNPRLIAALRKNRGGPSGRSFELFPQFPGITFATKADPMEHVTKRKPIFQHTQAF